MVFKKNDKHNNNLIFESEYLNEKEMEKEKNFLIMSK